VKAVQVVRAIHVERKQELTGKYEHVAAPDTMPELISGGTPKYPEKFINSDVTGKVKVFFVVNEQGVPIQVQYIEATDLAFAEESIEAVKEWRFKPALKNGLPAPACMVAPITFIPKRS